MQTEVEKLEANRYRLRVTISEADFNKDVDAAFRKLARGVKVPGFRPGKAPRKILEKQFGADLARKQALDDALPGYALFAAQEEKLDIIALIDDPREHIVAGEQTGDLTFEAVIEVRPVVTLSGYDNLELQLEGVGISDEDVENQVNALRERFADLTDSDTPLVDGDYATLDLSATLNGEELSNLSATDFLYPIGSAMVVEELDQTLAGKKPGDIVEFDAKIPDGAPSAGEIAQFRVLVKEAKKKILPEVTDEWVNDVSEFESIDELRADIRKRLDVVRKLRIKSQARDKALEVISNMVSVDIPDTLINRELRRRLEDIARDLAQRGASLDDFLQATGQSQEQIIADLREPAVRSVRAELALRAVIAAEGIEASEEEVAGEVARLAGDLGQKPDKLQRDLERRGAIEALRFELAMGKALEFLIERATVTDEGGNPIGPEDLSRQVDEVGAQ